AETGWEGIASKEKTSSSDGLALDGNASWNGRVDLFVKPALRFYEVISLEGRQGVYLRGYTQPRCDGLKWGLSEGYSGSLGIGLTIFDWWTPDMSIQLPGDELSLADGSFDYPVALPSWLEAVCGAGGNDALDALNDLDEGNPAEGAGPSDETTLPATETSWPDAQNLTCDTPVVGDTASAAFATDMLDGYSCNVGNYEGSEVVYT
ncbi:MAG TPA: hypothetical protein DIU15_14985, partial [Deltaproteobacteria bacterium]|nr:hypothetical protein [Deltaproteobacteria bacterium]